MEGMKIAQNWETGSSDNPAKEETLYAEKPHLAITYDKNLKQALKEWSITTSKWNYSQERSQHSPKEDNKIQIYNIASRTATMQ